MIKFQKLTLRNFLSYGNNTTTINLDNPGTVLIKGEDLDNTASGAGANGVGKAQPLYCKVKTPDGWTTIGDIKVGNVISTPAGVSANVIGVYPQGIRPVYRVTFNDGRSTEADVDHLWSVFSHRWGGQNTRGSKLLTTKELKQFVDCANEKQKAWYNVYTPFITPTDREDYPFSVDPYLLGVILGDGSISRTVSITSIDSHIIERCNRVLAENHNQVLRQWNTSVQPNINYHVCNNVVRSKGNDLLEKIQELGLSGADCYSKFIPQPYLLHSSVSQRYQLLAGLLDSDGTVGKTQNISFATSSQQLAVDVQYLVRSLGGSAKLSTRYPSYTSNNNKRRGQVSYNVSIRVPYPHQALTLPRKLERLSLGRGQYSSAGLRVTSVEYIKDAPTQCIMIDHPDHLYITDDFVVTHNTTLINALTYAMYDKPVSDISKDKLVNNVNQKNMEVSVEFEDDDGVQYRIVRTRKTKGGAAGNNVYLYINEEDKTLDSAANTNALIESIIGIPHEMFVRIVVFSASHTPFLDLPSRAQADLIEGLFGVTELSTKADQLKSIVKDTEARLNVKKAVIDQALKEQDRHKHLIINANSRVDAWDMQTAQTIVKLKSMLKTVESVDVEQQRQLHEEAEAVSSKVSACDTEIATKKRYLHTNDTRHKKVVDELTHLRDAKCPYCLQHFESAEDKIEALSVELEVLIEEARQLGEQIAEVGANRDALISELNTIKEQITVDDIAGLMKLAQECSSAQTRISELEAAVNPHLDTLNELLEMKFDDINYDEVNTLTREIEHQKFLLKLLTKNDSFIRKNLLNRYLPYLNMQLQHYLDELGLPHTVQFTHELAAKISRFGQELDFGNLSAGQRARVNFALSLAFKDVLQRLHTKINVCMLDEVLDHGLDTVGVQAAAKLVKRKARDEELSMFIVSHRDEVDGIFDRTMTVQMSQGFSNIKEEMTA